jgi:predicted nucleotidyltransferase
MFVPTPYADINAILLDFEAQIRSILGASYVGLYLYGSLALGDFDPITSDIDFIVVTQGPISLELFTSLQGMHTQFDQSNSPWAGKIEAAYIPQEALNHTAATAEVYPQVEKGTGLFWAPLEIGWVFQRYSLRERGVIVAGPSPRTLIDPVSPENMYRAVAVIAGGWQEQARHDPSWMEWVQQRSNLSFVVLTLCRLLYSLETGKVASKPTAARWMKKSQFSPWERLIQCSLAGQRDHAKASDLDLEEMLTLLSYTVEQSQKACASVDG